jgi:hypothetical protein
MLKTIATLGPIVKRGFKDWHNFTKSRGERDRLVMAMLLTDQPFQSPGLLKTSIRATSINGREALTRLLLVNVLNTRNGCKRRNRPKCAVFHHIIPHTLPRPPDKYFEIA